MKTLVALVEQEISQPVDPRVAELAAWIARQHGAASRAVLFYGSCLRERSLDGLMLDFYLIVSDYRAAYGKRWLAWLNVLLPPNVFPIRALGLSAKYAVLSEADFLRLASAETRNVSVWARFAQPSRLAWVLNEEARQATLRAIAGAAPALLGATLPTLGSMPADPLDLWREGLGLTYSAELRAERSGRPGSVVDADPDRYNVFTEPALAEMRRPAFQSAKGSWQRRRLEGKLLTIARLCKASLTFAGGIDYLVWKVNRHAGTSISLRPWQRRWPIVAAIILLPRLLARGVVR